MKLLNNLLLLGDGETWSRQKIDFSGLPEMLRTFLQVAAGAADIPVTRLLGQSPAGLSATGESDTRNYYDHVSARQELDLRPQLERLDALLLRSAGVDPSSLTFAFRPLWQMDGAAKATVALQKAQASQIYAGLNLWPTATTARLVEAQLAEDGTYPGAEGVLAEASPTSVETPEPPQQPSIGDFNFNPAQLRDPDGQWSKGGGGTGNGTTSEELSPPERAPAGRAPDGTPGEAAAFRTGGGKGLGHAIGVLLGAAARLLKRWRSDEPDDPAPTSATSQPNPGSSASSSGASANRIRFGSNANQEYHAFRHIEEAGLDQMR